MINDYASLSTRSGFNKSLSHFRLVSSIVQRLEKGENLADIIDEMEKDRTVEKSQIAPIMNAVVMDRMGYETLSFNQSADFSDFSSIQTTVSKWNRFDIIMAYHHPQVGISLVNPKSESQWEALQEVNREELVVLYIKPVQDKDRDMAVDALTAMKSLVSGEQAENTDRFHDPALKPKPAPKAPAIASGAPKVAGPPTAAPRPSGMPPVGSAPRAVPAPSRPPAGGQPAAAKKPASEAKPAAAPKKGEAPQAGGKKRVTPRYSIQVTNELFHNGNVEAWKNIVESYKAAYSGLDVHIFHDGAKVNNINALFKWGKVKNGDVILFSVAGEEIKGVAKLQRYLYEGASLRFENYLKKDVNKILNLF